MTFNARMHERNIYRNKPDFAKLALEYPEFRKYAIPNAKGKCWVDFSDPEALRQVTRILLDKDFNLKVEIPDGFLIPTVPQRLNYVLWIEDLLETFQKKNAIPSGIDIGTGPCSIFSLLGAKKNNWNFIATDSSDEAIKWANQNIKNNNLGEKVKVVKVNTDSVLTDILVSDDTCFEFCLCNPPFFENIEEIRSKKCKSSKTIADVAQKEEIVAKGGEVEFVRNIIKESVKFKDRIVLFSSMFGKKKSFLQILRELKQIENMKITTTEFCQGNTVRWGIAWTFNQSIEFKEVKEEKPKKPKPPMEFQLDHKIGKSFITVFSEVKSILNELEIPVQVNKSTKKYIELLLKSNENTWCHQRRKRRELLRQKIKSPEEKQSANSEVNGEIFEDTNKSEGDSTVNMDSEIKVENCFKSEQCPGIANSEVNKSELNSKITGVSEQMYKLNTTENEDKHAKCLDVKEILGNKMQSTKRNLDEIDEFSTSKKPKLSTTGTDELLNPEQYLLYCSLELIDGRSKIYVKMNCPLSANRNTMYQLFQFIKNKIS